MDSDLIPPHLCQRILAMTGPAGTGKTSTLKVLSQEMGFEILEWRNAIGEVTTSRMSEWFPEEHGRLRIVSQTLFACIL
jgi:ABC-type hemin transport system ATPase subunit